MNIPRESVRIKRLRKARGETQEQFARAVGVTLATVWNWEKGERKPNPLAMKRIEELKREQK